MRFFAYCRKSTEGEERQALSIPAQIDEIKRIAAGAPDIEIVDWFEERMSAKAPGRPVYTGMIERIERGEADGIVAWHPDRLARNSVDGGWIIHLLDRKVLKTLKFVSYSYEQSPEGMFMLQIMFGQSKYYVDNLSLNVRRGMRKKFEMGWHANLAPVGYRNDRDTATIAVDPERFTLLRKAWQLLLSGVHSVPEICDILNNNWGFRMPMHRMRGGGPIGLSTLYKIFSSPFYAGVLERYGERRPGKHEPMITLDEFKRAQGILGRPSRPKPETRAFAFTGGIIHCSCGLPLTAEEKVKPSGRGYVYYHCTRSRRPRCNEPAVRAEIINSAIEALLRELELAPEVEAFLTRKLAGEADIRRDQKAQQEASVAQALDQARRELKTLVDLRVRGLIEDDDFMRRRADLQTEELRLQQAMTRSAETTEPLELWESVKLFRKYAADWFREGDYLDKRLILKTLASNSVLSAGKLSIQAKKWFIRAEEPIENLYWCTIVETLGTPRETEACWELIGGINELVSRDRLMLLAGSSPSSPCPPPAGRATGDIQQARGE